MLKPQIRITDPKSLDKSRIESELRAGKNVIVQFSEESYSNEQLDTLNEMCSEYDSNFSIRFFGHYGSVFDFRTVLKIPKVKSLETDCLIKAKNFEVLHELDIPSPWIWDIIDEMIFQFYCC